MKHALIMRVAPATPTPWLEWHHPSRGNACLWTQTNVIATAANDRSIVLYDIRAASPLRKLVLAVCCCASVRLGRLHASWPNSRVPRTIEASRCTYWRWNAPQRP